jgi:FkbM family methyltransferase
VAIEPNPRHARLLHYSFSINGFLNRAEVHNLAVSDASGVAELHVDAHMTGGATLRPAGARLSNHNAGQDALMVEVATVDALLGARRSRINVVKMDVEGAEPAVLRGMAQLLVEARPLRMLLEFNGHAPGVTTGFRDLLPMLEREGFEPYRVISEAEVAPLGWERLLEGGRREDVVIARHDDRGWIHGL